MFFENSTPCYVAISFVKLLPHFKTNIQFTSLSGETALLEDTVVEYIYAFILESRQFFLTIVYARPRRNKINPSPFLAQTL